ncbi:MAG: AAA family ATPase [Lachnospiraceae bacterium]|nr:AAA family ATPase [Lachnospiraceae bacterium]
MNGDLYIRDVRISKEIPKNNYLSKLPVVHNLCAMGKLQFNKKVTFLVGENGIGKSTLIEGLAVAMGFNPEGGTVNFNFSTNDSHSNLHEYLTICKGYKRHRDGFFLRAESFYNVASNIDELDAEPGFEPKIISNYGGVSLHKQSHGESFMSLVENRFFGNGLYILDEPEAALSPMRLMRLMICMQKLVDNNSQFIISTHSPILMTFPNSEVLEITKAGIKAVDYKDTEHYIVTKRFMDAPEKILESLLGE